MDGNRRWAQSRGMPVSEGHRAGADTLNARLRDAIDLGIQELSLYSFSTENWARPEHEVRALMSLLHARIVGETPLMHKAGVRIRFLGRRDGVAPKLVEQIKRAEALTDHNRNIRLFVALNYGGRAEIVDAAERFVGGTEEDFRSCLYAPEMHDPELVIRTGGEQRLSNFLLWQTAYSEFVARDELWPDFTRVALEQSLEEFGKRICERRKSAPGH